MSIRWGVVGAGGIADRRTIPEGIMPSPCCELVAVMDADAGRARAVAEKYAVRHCITRLEDLLALPEVDAVYIATPNHLHRDQTVAAARAGKHVLVEKPFATTIAEAEEMIAACQEAGVKLMAGYLMRFHAHHRRLKAMVEAGELGQVVFGRAQLTCWYPEIPGAWRQDPQQSGGGALMDMGTHCLDLLEMLMGPIVQLVAFAGTLTFRYAVEDSATVLCKFASGAHGVVDVNFNVPDEAAQNVLELRGTRGAVLADHTIGQDAGGHMVAYLPQGSRGYEAAQVRLGESIARPVEVQPVDTYRAEIEHFVDCIEQGREPLIGGREALRILHLALLAYESARTGRVLAVGAG